LILIHFNIFKHIFIILYLWSTLKTAIFSSNVCWTLKNMSFFFFLIEKVYIKFSKDVLSSYLFYIFIINEFLFFSNSSADLNKCHILRLFNSFIHCNILSLKLIFIILAAFISLHDHLFDDQFVLNLKR